MALDSTILISYVCLVSLHRTTLLCDPIKKLALNDAILIITVDSIVVTVFIDLALHDVNSLSSSAPMLALVETTPTRRLRRSLDPVVLLILIEELS